MNTLPQTLLNLIGEFNPDHRDKMYDVLCEFTYKQRICNNCDEYIEDLSQRRICKWIDCKRTFCGITCAIIGEYDFFESRYG